MVLKTSALTLMPLSNMTSLYFLFIWPFAPSPFFGLISMEEGSDTQKRQAYELQ